MKSAFSMLAEGTSSRTRCSGPWNLQGGGDLVVVELRFPLKTNHILDEV